MLLFPLHTAGGWAYMLEGHARATWHVAACIAHVYSMRVYLRHVRVPCYWLPSAGYVNCC